MFFANILYAPILLYGFRWLLRDRHWLWLVVLFPFNVWVAEVLIGYAGQRWVAVGWPHGGVVGVWVVCTPPPVFHRSSLARRPGTIFW